MSSEPALSVVIPVHNAEETLEAQLIAVLKSIRPGMEVVVVDNRSSDRSRAIAEQIAGDHAAVRVIVADERAAEAYARNIGVAEARSAKIAFCDADDVVSTTWAPAMCRALDESEFVTGPVDVDELNPAWLAGFRGRTIYETLPRTLRSIPFAHGCNMGMRRELVLRLGGFDERYAAGTDVDFALRAHAAGVTLTWAPDAVVHYRHRRDPAGRRRQARAYGQAAAAFHRVAGVPWGVRARLIAQRRRALWLLRTLPLTYRRSQRARWAWTLMLAVGEIRGDGATDGDQRMPASSSASR